MDGNKKLMRTDKCFLLTISTKEPPTWTQDWRLLWMIIQQSQPPSRDTTAAPLPWKFSRAGISLAKWLWSLELIQE